MVPATLVSSSGVIPVTVVPVLYPFIVEDVPSFTLRWLGLSTTLSFLLLSLGAPMVGRFVDRIGARAGMTIAGLGTIAAVITIALASSLAWVVVPVVASGLLHSFAATSSNLVMGAVLDGRRPATLFGVRQTSVPLMSMLAGAVVAATTGWLDWRAIMALFVLVPGALLLTRPPRPSGSRDAGTVVSAADDHGDVEAARHGHADAEEPRGAPDLSGVVADGAPALEPLPRRELLVFATISLFSGMAVSVLSTFGVATLTAADWAPSTAGAIFAAASALGLTTRIVAGILVDRRGGPVFTSVGVLLAGGAVGAGLIVTGLPSGIAAGVLLAYGAGWGFPGLLQYGIASSFRARIASATGLVQLGSGMGVSLGPLWFSALEAWAGMQVAWSVVALSSATAAVIALVRVAKVAGPR